MSPLLQRVLNDIDQLTPAEQLQVMGHLAERLQHQLAETMPEQAEDDWDRQIAKDLETGKLDRLIAKAEAEIQAKQVKNLDEVLHNS